MFQEARFPYYHGIPPKKLKLILNKEGIFFLKDGIQNTLETWICPKYALRHDFGILACLNYSNSIPWLQGAFFCKFHSIL